MVDTEMEIKVVAQRGLPIVGILGGDQLAVRLGQGPDAGRIDQGGGALGGQLAEDLPCVLPRLASDLQTLPGDQTRHRDRGARARAARERVARPAGARHRGARLGAAPSNRAGAAHGVH